MKRISSAIFAVFIIWMVFVGTAVAENPLIIINLWPDARSTQADQKLKADFPDLEIEYRSIDDRHVLTTRFLSMDPEMDIVCFSEWDGVEGMYAAMEGALENLSDDPALVKCRDAQFDLWKNYTVGDLWYGVPCSPYQSIVYLNEALFEELGIEMPDNHWTWDDFWSLAQQVKEYNQANDTQYALFKDSSKSCIVSQYAANTVNYLHRQHAFTDAFFESIVRKWKNLYDEGLIWDPMVNRNRENKFSEANTLMVYVESKFGSIGNIGLPFGSPRRVFSVRLLPQTEQFQPSLISGYTLSVPIASRNKELAFRWLQYYMDAASIMDSDILQNGGPLYKDVDYLSVLTSQKKGTLANVLDLWIYGLNHSRLSAYNDLTHAVAIRYWWQLRDGQLTVEDYLRSCISLADQYLEE